MFDKYNDGYCPQCALERKQSVMQLNRDDHWECPICRLQMIASGGAATVLREHGAGHFRQPTVSATDYVIEAFMTREEGEDASASSGYFLNAEDLRAFLDSEVH